MCKKCDQLKAKREKLLELAMKKPRPCVVCAEPQVIGAATWIPDERHYLAAGGTTRNFPIFAFCLCEAHMEQTVGNEKLIAQAVLRELRVGKNIAKE